MNRDLLICKILLLAALPSVRGQEMVSTLADEVATLDLTLVEAEGSPRAVLVRQETVQQAQTPAVVTKTTPSEGTRRRMLPSVDSISGAEIRVFQRYDLADILSHSAGTSVVQTGQTGALTSLFIRGMESNHAVVLLNGRRLPPGLAGIYQLEYLDVSTLESVQITRGAASSLYGSDALAGVIDLRSTDARHVEADTVSSFVEAGSFSTFRTGHKVTMKDGPVSVALDASYLDTANDRPSSAFENAVVRGNVAVDLGGGAYLDVLGYVQDSFLEVPGSSLNPGFPEEQVNKNLSSLFSPRLRIERDDWDFSTFYSYTTNELEATKDSFFNDNLLEQTGHEIETVLTWRRREGATYTFGAGHYHYAFERIPLIPGPFNQPSEFEFAYTSFFSQADLELPGNLHLLTSGRFDAHDSFASKATYTAQLSHEIEATGTTLFGKVATGYKAPSGQDFIFLAPGLDPATLQPEESLTREIGVRQNFFEGRGSVALTYFEADVKNLIDVDPFTWVDPAIVDTDTRGFELEFVCAPRENLRFYTSATWLDAIIVEGEYLAGFGGSPGDRLPRRPRQTLSGGVVVSGDRWRAGAELRGAYDRLDSPGTYLDDFTVTRVFGSAFVSDSVEIYGRIENVFDLDYENTRGFEAAGFGIFGGVRIVLGR